ncbi:MAG TPA: VWA domain-containing protein [Blastocatellia bacterium]|nr:VWA domain-containing protein [Blastocatellia bacterium]
MLSQSLRKYARSLPAWLLVIFIMWVSSPAQSPKTQDETVKLKAHLITMDVTVKDKRGKYVTDLKADDFTIIENGTPQKLEFFDPPLVGTVAAGQPQPADATKPPATAGGPAHIISLVLDGATTEQTNLKPVREGLRRYIRERIAPADMTAVFAVTTDLRLLQSFTQDKEKLLAAVDKTGDLTASNVSSERNQIAKDIQAAQDAMAGLPGESALPATPAAASLGSGAAQRLVLANVLQQYLKLRSQLSVQQARPVLASLAAICEALRAVPGKKTLVLFSEGFVTPEILDWQVQSLIDIANRANVAIYIIDSAGLRTSTPLSTGPVPSSPLSGIAGTGTTRDRMDATAGGESLFDHARQEGLDRQHDILYRISGDTGGEFIKGSNDIGKSLDRIDQEIRARYTLAYYSTDTNFDGSFRKVKIEVRRPDARPESRAGYYANAGDAVVSLSADEKKLLGNLTAIQGGAASPVFLELSPFRFKDGHYIVPLALEVPPSFVKFERKGDKQTAQFEVLGVLRQEPQVILSRLGSRFNVALTDEQYKTIAKNNIFYRQDMELAPGTYTVELIVRDKLSGQMTARREQLVLPAADATFATSGIVLSRFAERARTTTTVDVFNQGGVQIRPLPSRAFHAGDNLIIFFEAYNAANNEATGKPMVRVTVMLMKDGKLARKPLDYVLSDVTSEPVPHLTFAKYITLAGLAAGDYTAVIETMDMVTHKLVKQQVPFAISE